eukprot:653838-Pleurochrysis_carterae.AAC.2
MRENALFHTLALIPRSLSTASSLPSTNRPAVMRCPQTSIALTLEYVNHAYVASSRSTTSITRTMCLCAPSDCSTCTCAEKQQARRATPRKSGEQICLNSHRVASKPPRPDALVPTISTNLPLSVPAYREIRRRLKRKFLFQLRQPRRTSALSGHLGHCMPLVCERGHV